MPENQEIEKAGGTFYLNLLYMLKVQGFGNRKKLTYQEGYSFEPIL